MNIEYIYLQTRKHTQKYFYSQLVKHEVSKILFLTDLGKYLEWFLELCVVVLFFFTFTNIIKSHNQTIKI